MPFFFSFTTKILSVAAETATGLTVIRAFKHHALFTSVFNRKIDTNTQFTFNEFVVNRWYTYLSLFFFILLLIVLWLFFYRLDTQLEWIVAIIVFLASAAAILMMDSLGPGTKMEKIEEMEEKGEKE